MSSLKDIKFSRQTDPELFKVVLTKMYPQLAHTKEGYLNGSEPKGKNVSQLIEQLSKDLSQKKLSAKFSKYPNYLLNLSKRDRDNDITLRSFSKVITDLSGYHTVSMKKTKTEETVTVADKNVVKMKDVEVEVVEGKVQKIKIGEIEIIPERITTTTTIKTELEMNVTYQNEYDDYLSQVRKLSLPQSMAKRDKMEEKGKLDEFILDKLHDYIATDIVKYEEEWFSYSKCQKYLSENLNQYDNFKAYVKVDRIIDRIFDDDKCDIVDVYNSLLVDIEFLDEFTFNEKAYIQLKIIALRLKNFSTYEKKIYYTDDECIIEYKEKLEKLADLFMFKDIPFREFPMDIRL